MALKLACNDLAAPGFCNTILFRQCLVVASVKLLADLLIPEIAAYFFPVWGYTAVLQKIPVSAF